MEDADRRVLLSVLGRTAGQVWLQSKMPRHWYGVSGRPSSQAAWSRVIAACYAKVTGSIAVGLSYDVSKAFDHLDWRVVQHAARTLGFPIVLLRFLLRLYVVRRHVVIGNGIARSSSAMRSSMAGCTFADLVIFLVMAYD